MDCNDCSKKSTCTKLCEDFEKYADQEYAGRRETIFHEGDVSEMFANAEQKEWPGTTKSIKELIFLMRFEDLLTQTQIAENLNVSQQYVSKVLCEIKNKTLNG